MQNRIFYILSRRNDAIFIRKMTKRAKNFSTFLGAFADAFLEVKIGGKKTACQVSRFCRELLYVYVTYGVPLYTSTIFFSTRNNSL